jgi:hypothetical protein
MRKEKQTRQSAITVEYLITTIVALGIGASLVALGNTASNTVTTAQSGFANLEQKLSLAQDGNNSAQGSTQTSNQELLSKDSLDDYTWAELKTIANDLSANGEQSVYYAKMTELMQSGSTKTFETDSSVIGERVKVRIIGICQDVKTDNTTAGLTFQTTHALATAQQMNASNSNLSGWGSTAMRTWLNDTVYNALPSDLTQYIVQVKKYYGATYNSTSNTTTSTSDKLFLLSSRELYDYTNSSYPWYALEGTGSSHNQQYQYYSYKGVTTSNYSLLAGMYLDYNGNTPGSFACWWLRSVLGGSSSHFRYVCSGGNYNGNYASYSGSVVPSFSL